MISGGVSMFDSMFGTELVLSSHAGHEPPFSSLPARSDSLATLPEDQRAASKAEAHFYTPPRRSQVSRLIHSSYGDQTGPSHSSSASCRARRLERSEAALATASPYLLTSLDLVLSVDK